MAIAIAKAKAEVEQACIQASIDALNEEEPQRHLYMFTKHRSQVWPSLNLKKAEKELNQINFAL